MSIISHIPPDHPCGSFSFQLGDAFASQSVVPFLYSRTNVCSTVLAQKTIIISIWNPCLNFLLQCWRYPKGCEHFYFLRRFITVIAESSIQFLSVQCRVHIIFYDFMWPQPPHRPRTVTPPTIITPYPTFPSSTTRIFHENISNMILQLIEIISFQSHFEFLALRLYYLYHHQSKTSFQPQQSKWLSRRQKLLNRVTQFPADLIFL